MRAEASLHPDLRTEYMLAACGPTALTVSPRPAVSACRSSSAWRLEVEHSRCIRGKSLREHAPQCTAIVAVQMADHVHRGDRAESLGQRGVLDVGIEHGDPASQIGVVVHLREQHRPQTGCRFDGDDLGSR
jgi:hypothetical protein